MKYQLLLLWTLAAFWSGVNMQATGEIDVQNFAEYIELSCKEKNISGNGYESTKRLKLYYRDDNSGEYKCENVGDKEGEKIFVKLRTCDNCVELDTPSIVGLAVGDVVATIVVGVAVYLIATQARTSQVKPAKKKSDREKLVRNEVQNDDNYQKLIHRGRSEYDEINKK
ncbi:T-cell surface glycoprotein CD3 delta chain-like isoform X1 [Cyprinodon tularosa]|uniref:T-cell surface glycoprotein CD3 delta chain-like isoform X1 n=1 Tax=Cyprinodon tularosa TaxID=77115 RepID=UPI0018E2910A|nr:T-cell surface glycoprotein CD3 delta chain-like isoform X1 [Cyprinodon tularosa]